MQLNENSPLIFYVKVYIVNLKEILFVKIRSL